jgi:PIN domain nuclease of toxin-antitoxin system
MPTSNTAQLPVLLDTHVLMWVLEQQDGELSANALQKIRHASRHSTVYVSAISLWEVAMLVTKKRVQLSAESSMWIRRALQAPGVKLLPLLPEISVASTLLPGDPPRDPADRILIATTRHVGARLVTCDRRIIQYAQTERAFAILDARP